MEQHIQSPIHRGRGITVSVIIIISIIALVAFAVPRKSIAPVSSLEKISDRADGTSDSMNEINNTTASLSYTDALIKYQNRVVRITDACVIDPIVYSFNVPMGQQIMIANDSTAQPHSVSIDGSPYVLASHHYKLMNIKKLGTVYTVCDMTTGITTVSIR